MSNPIISPSFASHLQRSPLQFSLSQSSNKRKSQLSKVAGMLLRYFFRHGRGILVIFTTSIYIYSFYSVVDRARDEWNADAYEKNFMTLIWHILTTVFKFFNPFTMKIWEREYYYTEVLKFISYKAESIYIYIYFLRLTLERSKMNNKWTTYFLSLILCISSVILLRYQTLNKRHHSS